MGRISTLTAGALVGALLLWMMNGLWNWGSPDVPVMVTGALAGLGTVACIRLLGIWRYGQRINTFEPQRSEAADGGIMRLREERLTVSKQRVQTADVEVHRETVTDSETLTVPITREELVVKRNGVETMRIPVREERVEVRKIPVVLQDVKVYTEQSETEETVKEMLRKETARLEVSGDADIWERNQEQP